MRALAQTYADALWDAAEGLDAAAAERLIDGFIALMAKRGHLPDAPSVVDALEARARREAGVVDVTLATAAPLDGPEAGKIGTAIGKALGADISLEHAVDPSLIGGAVIRTRDTLIDASVRHRLEILKARLAE